MKSNGDCRIINRFQIAAFLLVSFFITWTIWLSIPRFTGENWILVKIWVGVGIFPGLTAVLFDRFRNGWNELDFNRSWWVSFCCVAATVMLLLIWSLLDVGVSRGISSTDVRAPGLGFVGLVAAILSAGISGFVFATARSSKTDSMNTISYFHLRPVWLLTALFLPVLLCGISVGISLLLGNGPFEFPLLDEIRQVWLHLLGSFLISLFVVTVGEETGWRGYLLPELQRRFSPLISTLILGLLWGLWHLPLYYIGLYNLPGNWLVNALMFTLFAIVFSFQFTWIFNRTGGVLSLALLLHASTNTTFKILPSSPWLLPVMAVFAIFLVVREKMWKRVSAEI